MSKLTITESLAEIKTATARIVKKREAVMRYFSRDSRLRDPLESDGGSKEFIRAERQSIRDLETRIVSIRTAIQKSNLQTVLTIGAVTRNVSEWLNWRREISNGQKGFLNQMATTLTQIRQQVVRQGMAVTDKENAAPGDVIVAVSEQELAKDIEDMEGVLGVLDGKLSLLNATVTIDV